MGASVSTPSWEETPNRAGTFSLVRRSISQPGVALALTHLAASFEGDFDSVFGIRVVLCSSVVGHLFRFH
jgi:hypothetical protein